MKLNEGFQVHPKATDYYITFYDLLDALESGIISRYENNRGSSGETKARIEKIACQFDPLKFGMICVEKKGRDEFTQITGHHRCGGLQVAFSEGLLNDDDLSSFCLIRVLEQGAGMDVYIAEGAAKGHTTRQKITNPDLGLGSVLSEKLYKHIQIKNPKLDFTDVFKNQYSNAIIYCVLNALKYPQSEWKNLNYIDVSKNKKTGIQAFVDLSTEELQDKLAFNPQKMSILRDSLQWTADIIVELNSLAKNSTTEEILKQASFFGFLLWSKVSSAQIGLMKPSSVANKIYKYDSKILDQAKLLRLQPDLATEKLKIILNKKQ